VRLSEYLRVHVLTTIAEVNSQTIKRPRIFVATMGALHKAHLELIRVAREQAGKTGEVVVSIFVNPLQFEPGADYERYPRPEKADEDFCRNAGVDLLFRPMPVEMYADDRSVFVTESSLSKTLCGKSRPGHFRGVCTVVTKLFNVLSPDAAVFGEKDFQQLAIIRRMARDLNFKVDIVGVATVRENDGLAYSSRNRYLSAEERQQATVLQKALLKGAEMMCGGETSTARIVSAVRETIGQAVLARIDYVDLVDAENLQPIEVVRSNSLLALAVFFGKTRLIDNILLP
jgi:pantoate--beta-alanine ligase